MGATARTVDMSNVKERSEFNQSRIPAGDYLAMITKVEDAVTKSKKDSWIFTIKLKNRPSSVFRYQCLLDDNMLWKVRNLAVAAGKTVPKKRIKLDPNQLVGKLIGVSIEDADDYVDKNDKVHEQSEIAGVFPAADMGDDDAVTDDDAPIDDDDEDDDDDDLGGGPRFTPSDDEDEDDEADDEPEADDEEEDDEAEDLSGLTRTELKARIVALQPDFQARKSQSDDDLRGVLQGLLEADSDEAEEEPEPAPKKKAAPASSAAKRKAAKQKVADDDIDDLDIDDL